MKYKLLIVDDEAANLRLLERLFSPEYQCLTAASGAEAIRVLEQHDVAIVITDQRMPEMTGIQLLKQTAALRPHMVRMLLTGYTDVEALVETINCGLVYMYVTKPWNNDDLKLKVSRAREHYENIRKGSSLAQANERLLIRLKEIKHSIVASLAEMSATRNQEAYDHALRVRKTACAIADQMGLSGDEKEDLAAAATLNDLSQVNGGPRPSTPSSAAMKRGSHSDCEARLLSAIPDLGSVADILSFRGENFDGSGNPRGARADQIPTGARILRIADEYNSILCPRASVATMTHDEAMRFLSQRAGKQFDPAIIAVMQQLDSKILSQDLDVSQFPEMKARRFTSVAGDRFEPSFVDSMYS